ncbi:MAG: ABC transporter permease [Candidatus Aenigmarchaeota archaeon]|nr:ABC transporter permease [Candidatus Aenigmarchaeota archaeon]
MLDLSAKELTEHKLRTFLTSLGIVIAIAAIVSLGSISAGMDAMVKDTLRQMGADKIIVTKKITAGLGAPMIPAFDEDIVDDFKAMNGVDDAVPIIRTNYLGSVPLIGIEEKDRGFMQMADVDFKEGGWFFDDDTDSVVVGKDFAEARNLNVGDELKIENRKLTVVGIIDAGEMRGLNMMIALPYRLAQDLLDMEGKATVVLIKPGDITQADAIKEQIRDEYEDYDAMTTEDMLARAGNIVGTIGLITIGIGVITSLVAAVGIIITMISSIAERKRQLGIMKAVGASTHVIMMQILQESLIMSIVSGIAGLLIGYMLVGVVNNTLLAGMQIAAVTPALAAGAFLYGIMLSIVSALYPAWKASRTDPIEAIRS